MPLRSNYNDINTLRKMLSPFMILFHLLVLSLSLAQPTLNDEFTPSQSQQVIMQTSQYHFVPSGSSFQYSLASWQEGADSEFIDRITVSYTLQILSTAPNYNFLVLYTDSNNNSQPYTQYNCYVRAVNEGLPQLMDGCDFPFNPVANGSCARAIEQAAGNVFSSSSTFFNCSDLNFTYNITSPAGVGPLNGTLLFIIDNSGLFPLGGSDNEMKLIMGSVVVANVNEEERAKFYLFVGLTGILIAIMIIIAVALNCKIRKLDGELANSKVE